MRNMDKRVTPKRGQLQRFKEAAREHGADVSEAEFDRALRKVASAPPAPMPKAAKRKPSRRGAPKRISG